MAASRVLLALILTGALTVGLAAPALALWSAAGGEIAVGTTTLSDLERYWLPVVAPDAAMATDGRFVVAWRGADRVAARRYAPDGSPRGGEIRVSTTTDGYQLSPAVAMADDGRFVVVWTSEPSYLSRANLIPNRILGQRFSADGTPDGAEFQVTTANLSASEPDIAIAADGGFVVVWSRPNPAIEKDYNVYARRYAADGAPLGGEEQVNASTTACEGVPVVGVAADGQYVVVWPSVPYSAGSCSGSTNSIYARQFGADGAPRGDDFLVNTSTFDIQAWPAVAVAADGRFVITWGSSNRRCVTFPPGACDTDFDIYARRYGTDGNPLGGDVRINTVRAENQFNPDVGLAADGRVLIVWEVQGTDLHGQWLAADGARQGDEFRVNPPTSVNQSAPSVAMDGSGHAAVAWTIGSDTVFDTVAQRYLWTHPPVAQNDAYALSGPSLTVPAGGVLSNDTDPDGIGLTATLTSAPGGGSLTLNPNGGFTYTPGAGFKGTDQFSYVASSGVDRSSPATVTITGVASACLPRPRVEKSVVAGGGLLHVAVIATTKNGGAPNTLMRLEFGTFQNARVTLGGQQISAGQIVILPSNAPIVNFFVQRVVPGQPTTVPLTVVDGCGSWRTFVGGGVDAGF